MVEEYLSLKISKLAKEKGFQRGVMSTQSLLQRWLREKHNIHVTPLWCYDFYSCEVYDMREGIKGCRKMVDESIDWDANLGYEEALERGLEAALNLI